MDGQTHQVRFQEEQDENAIDKQNRALIQHSKLNKKKITHEEWIRCKEHQQNLREVLILEAKRDLYEKFLMMQAEQDERNQERSRRMYEWEERKHV